MEQLSETASVDRELAQARQDLRETLYRVSNKVEEVEFRLQPQPSSAGTLSRCPLVAGLVGFFAGSYRYSRGPSDGS
jgi:hypothetical protein